MRDLHVVYTDYSAQGHGWGIECPQAPSLSAGRDTIEEALNDTEFILEFAGFPPGSYRLHRHEQKFVISPAGNEFLLRFVGLDDPHEDARAAVIGRELYTIEQGQVEVDGDLDRMPTNPLGERLIIAVVPTDTLGWVLDQLWPGEGAIAAFYAGEDAVYSLPIFDGDRELGRGNSLEALGVDRTSTVSELFDRVLAQEAGDLKVRVDHLHLSDA